MVILQSMLRNTDIYKTNLNIYCEAKRQSKKETTLFFPFSICFDVLKCLSGSSYIGAITVLKGTVYIIWSECFCKLLYMV